MGDYNGNTINELKSGTTSVHDFSNIFSTYYYHKLINLPTRERKRSSTLLDNIYKYSGLLQFRLIWNSKISDPVRSLSNFYNEKKCITA